MHVASGAQAYCNAGGTYPNNFFLAGVGIDEGTFTSAPFARRATAPSFSGTITLTGPARIGNRGAQANAAAATASQGMTITGKITGNFPLELSGEHDQATATT